MISRVSLVVATFLLFPLVTFAATCTTITKSLSLGSRDAQVITLKRYLVSEGLLQGVQFTNYFGSSTELALKQWQKRRGIVASGTPRTTGYGITGPRTRAALKACNQTAIVPPLVSVPTQIQTPSIVYTGGGSSTSVQPPSISTPAPPPLTYAWVTDVWSACGNGTQTRAVRCVSSTGDTAAPGLCTATQPTTSQSCTVSPTPTPQASCLLGGQTIEDGQSIVMYLASYVPYGSQCVNENRICSNGSLSGSYTYNTCTIAAPTNLSNGVQCTASSQCSSGYCYPGPESKNYCISQAMQCARPGTDGVLFGTTYSFGFDQFLCTAGQGLIKQTPLSCISSNVNLIEQIKSKIANNQDVCFTAGSFDLGTTSIVVDGTSTQKSLSIYGAGSGNTILQYSGCGSAIELKGTIANTTIRDFRIEGNVLSYYTDGDSPTQCAGQSGIVSQTGQSNISNLTIKNMYLSKLRNGIALNGGCTAISTANQGQSCFCSGSSCAVNNTITQNTIVNMLGMRYVYDGVHYTDQSTGYGIATANQKNLLISGNTFDSITRHSIYIAAGLEDSSYTVTNNTIKNHRIYGRDAVVSWAKSAAIVVARTLGNVLVSNNTIINAYATGISAEVASSLAGLIESTHTHILNNSFTGGSFEDIWISTNAEVELNGNTRGSGSAVCVRDNPNYNPSCRTQN